MVDRKVLQEAQRLGHECYMDGKDPKRNNPWLNVEGYEPYAKQMLASYDEAKRLFESDDKDK